MPRLLPYSLSALNDVEGSFSLRNLYLWWLRSDPLSIMCADQVLCPKVFCTPDQSFSVEVGYPKSDAVLSESFSHAWNEFVRAGIIAPLPVTSEIREACRVATYAVHNRLRQTQEGNLQQLSLSAKVNMQPSNPLDLLSLDGEGYCSNHLDSYALHLVLSKALDAIWIPDPRGRHAMDWFFAGKYNAELSTVDATRAILTEVSRLRLPALEFIPRVSDCSQCENRESHCYSEHWTPEEWVRESKVRVGIVLELWDSKEVRSLRRLLNEIRNNLAATTSESATAAVEQTKRAMIEAADLATKRMKTTLKKIDTASDVVTLVTGPMAVFGATTGNALLGTLGTILTGGTRTISAGCKLILNERYRWTQLRELKVDDEQSMRDWLARL
jgi:hypothetical protein